MAISNLGNISGQYISDPLARGTLGLSSPLTSGYNPMAKVPAKLPKINIPTSTGGGGFFGKMGSMFGANKLSSAQGAGISMAGSVINKLGNSLISDGMSTGAGNAVADIGGTVGGIVGNFNPVLGGIISAGTGIIGGVINRGFGYSIANEGAMKSNAARLGGISVGDDFSSMASATSNAGLQGTGRVRNGWFNHKGDRIASDLMRDQLAAQAGLLSKVNNAGMNIDRTTDNLAQASYAALGGFLGNPFNPNNTGALGIMQQDAYVDAINNRSNAMYGRRNNGVYAFGGELGTNGADFTNGLLQINAGGLHETNPYQGVQMGVDAQGTPNLVEQGETVFNDYVFSNRMKVPEALHRHFGLGGKLKDGISFADASKKIAKESEERPNDPISIAGLNETLARLAEVQEAERQREQAEEVINSYALGGPVNTGVKSKPKREFTKENAEDLLHYVNEKLVYPDGRHKSDLEKFMNYRLGIPERKTAKWFKEPGLLEYFRMPNNSENTINTLGEGIDAIQKYGKRAVDYIGDLLDIGPVNTTGGSGYIPSQYAQGGLMGNLYAGRGNRSQTLRRTGLPLTVPERISLGIQPDNVFGTVVPEIPVIPSDYAGSLPVVLDNGYPKYGRYNMGVEVDNNFIPDLYPEVARDISVPAYETPFNVNRYGRVNMGYYPDNNFAIDIPEIPAVGGVTGSSLPNNVRTQSAFRVNPYGRVTLGVHPGIPDTVPEDAAVEVAKEPEVLSPSVANVARSSQAALDVNPYGRVTLGVNMANPAREFNTNIYDQGYYNRWRLTAGRNRQGGNRPAATSPAANAPSQASNAEAPQGKAPDYNALATQELNPFNTNMSAVPDKIGMVNGTPVSLYSSRVKAAEEALRNQTPGLNTSAQQTLGTATSPFQGNSEDDENDVTKYATWPRYAPPFFNGLMVATDALGLTNKGDYSSADKIEAAANALGYTPSIAPEPVGNYMKYIPMDITYGLNQLAAQSNAANRGLENVAGTRGAAMAGIIANSNNAQTATGNMYRQALEYNDALQKQVEAFNSDIDKFSSQMSLEAAIANARYRQAGRQLRLAGLGQAASLRDAIDQRLGAAKSANLTNFVNSLGNIGRENFIFNQINASSPANNNYGIERSGSTTHKGKSMLKSKKGKNTKKNGGNG